MMAGSSASNSTQMLLRSLGISEGGVQVRLFRPEEEILSVVRERVEDSYQQDTQIGTDIESMRTRINDMITEYNPGSCLTDEQIDAIVVYTCGNDSEVVALRNQNNTHVSIPGQCLSNKGVSLADVRKVEQKIMKKIYANVIAN
jgi:hypothetical protein